MRGARYALAGFKIIPLHNAPGGRCTCGKADCTSPGKHPRTEHGAHDATSDTAVIGEWWGRKWRGANIGLVLDGLVAVDIDPRNGGDVDALPHELPETCTAKTGGGGWHHLYRGNGAARYPGQLAPGIDCKAGGGAFIAVEPSVHASGAAYSWVDESEPWNMIPPRRRRGSRRHASGARKTRAPGRRSRRAGATRGSRAWAGPCDTAACRRRRSRRRCSSRMLSAATRR